MNRDHFLKIMEGKGPDARQDLTDLDDVIKIFPYFQGAYMLLLKGLHNTSDISFGSRLKQFAIRIANREVLYNYLYQFTSVSGVQESNDITSTEEPAKPSEDTDNQQTVIDSARNSEDFIHTIEKEEIAPPKEDNDQEKGIEEHEHSVLISTEDNYDDSFSSVLLIDEDSGEIEERVVFMDPGFSADSQPELLEFDEEDSSSIAGSHGETVEILQNQERTREPSRSQSELIEQFILANPRIEPVRIPAGIPVEDISKPFTEETGGFVTETLAKIYVSQGYYSKAIDIYEKLSLKFPEKSSYFAALIEKVKELINK